MLHRGKYKPGCMRLLSDVIMYMDTVKYDIGSQMPLLIRRQGTITISCSVGSEHDTYTYLYTYMYICIYIYIYRERGLSQLAAVLSPHPRPEGSVLYCLCTVPSADVRSV